MRVSGVAIRLASFGLVTWMLVQVMSNYLTLATKRSRQHRDRMAVWQAVWPAPDAQTLMHGTIEAAHACLRMHSMHVMATTRLPAL